jgi:hypothetical protein
LTLLARQKMSSSWFSDELSGSGSPRSRQPASSGVSNNSAMKEVKLFDRIRGSVAELPDVWRL